MPVSPGLTTSAAPMGGALACPTSYVGLMYHNITRSGESYSEISPSATAYFVGESDFDEQLTELGRTGRRILPPDQLQTFYSAGEPRTSTAGSNDGVLITFDDGWRDCVEVGGAMLRQRGMQALLFVTTDFLGRPRFLSREDLRRLDHASFRIGSHARTHRMLNLLDEAEIRSELEDSKKLLEDLTGCPVESLSIPSGAVDARVRRIAAECGYRYVFDSEIRVNRRGGDPLAIGRVALMHNTPMDVFRRYVHQKLLRERTRRMLLQAPKRLLGLRRYERLRRKLLGEKPEQAITHES